VGFALGFAGRSSYSTITSGICFHPAVESSLVREVPAGQPTCMRPGLEPMAGWGMSPSPVRSQLLGANFTPIDRAPGRPAIHVRAISRSAVGFCQRQAGPATAADWPESSRSRTIATVPEHWLRPTRHVRATTSPTRLRMALDPVAGALDFGSGVAAEGTEPLKTTEGHVRPCGSISRAFPAVTRYCRISRAWAGLRPRSGRFSMRSFAAAVLPARRTHRPSRATIVQERVEVTMTFCEWRNGRCDDSRRRDSAGEGIHEFTRRAVWQALTRPVLSGSAGSQEPPAPCQLKGPGPEQPVIQSRRVPLLFRPGGLS